MVSVQRVIESDHVNALLTLVSYPGEKILKSGYIVISKKNFVKLFFVSDT